MAFNIFSILEVFCKFAKTDPIATNKTELENIPENFFSKEDDIAAYHKKLYNLYYGDIYKAHFERYVKLYKKEGDSDDVAKERALKKIEEITLKQTNKSLDSHTSFVNEFITMGLNPGDKVVAPGSGSGDEQVLFPELDWHGLEYQQNLVNLSNQRNQQMGINSKNSVWSFLNVDPTSDIGENWEENINTFEDITGKPKALYAKHACGGITDGVLYRAVNMKIPKLFLATCCANRYTQVSWRVLKPTNDDGTLMSYKEYEKVAHNSKRADDLGKECVNKIDQWRQSFLEQYGYKVERGRNSFGPYIKASLSN